jgi:hypothetical protein
MSENFQNTSNVKTNAFNKGMVKDYTDIYISEGLWTNAINAINNAHTGETGSLGNEPSNKYCASAPYTVIGIVRKSGTEWVIFSTNNTDSEIGILDESTCSYNVVVNDKCLGFRTTNLITGVAKKNYDCTYSVYWQDNLNPDRAMNLDRVPYKVIGDANDDPDCYTPLYSDELDCDALRLHPLVKQPCVTVEKSAGAGQLNNGSYIATIAYSENGIRLTDYSIPSQPQGLWDHTGIGGSLDIVIDNLDQDFNEYELVIISVVNQQTIAKKIGNYSVRQKLVHVDLIQQALATVDLGLIPLKSIVYEKSEKMFTVNGYLIRSGVTSQPYFNYQPLANQILTEWVAVEYPRDYYFGGGNHVGYMRDEVYSFFIRWVYKTGARSASFHIPGRIAMPQDVATVSTPDVINPVQNKTWQVYDTSTKYTASGSTADGGVIVNKGKMAYWESTERYPDDNVEVWGPLCGKPIRHHKMPSNETTHIHNQGGDKITILGVQFSNIKHPVDANGVPLTDIVGYEILRGSREGNRSIVAKGLFNNMMEYDLQGNTGRKGLIQNYPYNDLRPDSFLTDDYTVLDDGSGNVNEIESTPKLNKYKKNILSFHSVETNFVKPYLGANHIKIYTEERGIVEGKFAYPHKHPKQTILTDGAFAIATVVGAGLAVLAVVGKTTTEGQIWVAPFGTGTVQGQSSEATPATIIPTLVSGAILNPIGTAIGTAAGVAALIAAGAFYLGQGTNQVLELFRKIFKGRDYLLQYNSHGFYGSYSPVANGAVPAGLNRSFSRKIAQSGAKYIGAGMHDLDAVYKINNLYRNKYVALKLNSDLPNPVSIPDNTKVRLKDAVNLTADITYKNPTGKTVKTNTVAYYGAVKVDFENQYGQLTSITQLPTGSCVTNTKPDIYSLHESDVIFGGDVYINRYTEKNPYLFFNTWLYDLPDSTPFDYRNYVNGPAPRYWANFEPFDFEDFNFSLFPNGFPSTPLVDFNTPSSYHRFDRPAAVTGAFSVKNAYAYLFHNGVRDFYTESELNMAYRDYGEEDYQKFWDPYGASFTDEDTMFRSDLITKPIYYEYDLSLSAAKLFNNFGTWGIILPRDYNPSLYSTCFEYYPKRAIYSLQQQEGLKRDNWRNFLPLNYKDFGGRINTIKALNATGAVVLFEDAEPVQFVGVDQLQTKNGVKVTIGDGGLFAGNMQGLVNADDAINYGASISSRAAVNTPFGLFWVSQKNGKVMQFAGSIEEISRNGMKFWFNENLPSAMLQAYPDYPLYDNPVAGIGVQAIYDPQYELLYFTKRDYIPLRDDLHFDDPSGVPYYYCGTKTVPGGGSESGKCPCEYTNPACFQPCGWTISYDPKNKMWISFHDWRPTLMMPSNQHFLTVNGDSFWKHNDSWDSFANYYGQDYPWEVEFPIVTPNAVTTLRNVEYYMDVYKYFNDGKDFHHVLDENFDRAIVYNSEQVSGLLKLNLKGKNTPLDSVNYPVLSPNGIDILYSKEENKFRFNQFWDVTNDRGEFSGEQQPIWNTKCSGYERVLNPANLNYYKSPLQRKKFRHYGNYLILRKNVSGDKKMILKLSNAKQMVSPR